MNSRFSDIVKRALLSTVTNIGQLSHQEKLDLEYAVRKGWLTKGKGGPFPILKTVYARPGFDFAADRFTQVEHMLRLHALDVALGVAKFFPPVSYQELRRPNAD